MVYHLAVRIIEETSLRWTIFGKTKLTLIRKLSREDFPETSPIFGESETIPPIEKSSERDTSASILSIARSPHENRGILNFHPGFSQKSIVLHEGVYQKLKNGG
jgi:hypothetical protein